MSANDEMADWMATLTWKCDICHKTRPDAAISVHKVDITPANFPPGCVIRNVKYCNDNDACFQTALGWKERNPAKMQLEANCGCGGKMISHPWRRFIYICDRSRWWNRRRGHAYLVAKAGAPYQVES